MVTEAVYQLHSSSAPGEDGIYPEFLKPLDVVDLSWLTRLCRMDMWTSGAVPLEWVLPNFKKGDQRVFQVHYQENTRRNNVVSTMLC